MEKTKKLLETAIKRFTNDWYSGLIKSWRTTANRRSLESSYDIVAKFAIDNYKASQPEQLKVSHEEAVEVMEEPEYYPQWEAGLMDKMTKFDPPDCIAYDKATTISQDKLDLNIARAKIKGLDSQRHTVLNHTIEREEESKAVIEKLKGENKRLSDRDCNATVQLCYETKDYPFNREDLKIVDVGVSDNIYIVESEVLKQANETIAQQKEVIEKLEESHRFLENVCIESEQYLKSMSLAIPDNLKKVNTNDF